MSEGTTPNGGKIYLWKGVVQWDITALVQVAYDITVNSMDWGSGFLSTEEQQQIRALGEVCGFDTV